MSSEQGRGEGVKGWIAWGRRQRPVRALMQFVDNDGSLLAAGMSYRAVFAVFAAIWLGFSVAGIWLAQRPDVFDALLAIIGQSVPGLVGEGGLISADALQKVGGSLGWTSAIAAIGLVWTAISWLGATRQAVRAMFDLGKPRLNAVVMRLRDLGLALAFGLVLVVAALVSSLSTALLESILIGIGLSPDTFWGEAAARAVSAAIVIALNTAALAGMFRVLSRVAIPFRVLVTASLAAALVMTAMSTASGLLLSGASSNPLVASFAVFIGLLIWFNLVCRVILLAAAWIAVRMRDHGVDPRMLTDAERAREREVAEAAARVEAAREDYRAERRRYTEGGRLHRLRNRRRLTRARRRLDDALDEADDVRARDAARRAEG